MHLEHPTNDSMLLIKFVKYRYRAMRTAPPAAATLAPLAAGAHRARRAPACARVPPRCAHTHAQVVIVTVLLNMHKAYNLQKLAMVQVVSHWAAFQALLGCCGHHGHAARVSARRWTRCPHRQLPGAPIMVKSSSLASDLSSQILLCM